MTHEQLLPPETLARYADAIVRASLGVEKGDTLVVQGEPEHRELLVAVAESAYRAGAQFVDAITVDSLVMRARLLYGTADALGGVSPWALRRYRELADPRGALAVIAGEGDEGYFDGVSPERVATTSRDGPRSWPSSSGRNSTCARGGRSPAGRRTSGRNRSIRSSRRSRPSGAWPATSCTSAVSATRTERARAAGSSTSGRSAGDRRD